MEGIYFRSKVKVKTDFFGDQLFESSYFSVFGQNFFIPSSDTKNLEDRKKFFLTKPFQEVPTSSVQSFSLAHSRLCFT